MRVVVAQIGAREHYLAAVALARSKRLAALVTDWYAPRNEVLRHLLTLGGRTGRRMLEAEADGVPYEMVHAFRLRTLLARMGRALRGGNRDTYRECMASDERFARRVSKRRLPDHDVLFVYSYAAREAMEVARCLRCVIVPKVDATD